MCRFKHIHIEDAEVVERFQYILCVGSRIVHNAEKVNEIAFQYILCVGSSNRQR